MTAMRKWFRVGRLRAFGAPIYFHWSVPVAVAFLLALSITSPIHATVSIVSYLGIITLHELGHSIAAHRLGYTVEAIWINFIHGRCEFEAPEYEWDHVRIAWAGVLAQLAVAVPVLVAASIFQAEDFGYLAPAVIFLGYVNLFIAFLNLAPGAGFDGQVAWRVLPLWHEGRKAKRATKKAISSLAKRR